MTKTHVFHNRPVKLSTGTVVILSRKGRASLLAKWLQHLILALADQQIVTGIALMAAFWIDYSMPSTTPSVSKSGAATGLVINLGFLASSSHLAGIINLKAHLREHRVLALFRIGLHVTFSGGLLAALFRFRPLSLSLFEGPSIHSNFNY